MKKSKSFLSVIPAVAASLLPAGLCPVCWTAYTGLLSSLGCSFLLKTEVLLPLVVVCLLVSLVSLAYKAKQNRGYNPFILGLLGSIVILGGKFVLGSDASMYIGIGILVVASIWNSWPRRGSCRAPRRNRSE